MTSTMMLVADDETEIEEVLMARAKRKKSPNDDLVEAAENSLPHILMFYKRFEDKRPVMLLDLQSQKIYAYPYEEFKADLSERVAESCWQPTTRKPSPRTRSSSSCGTTRPGGSRPCCSTMSRRFIWSDPCHPFGVIVALLCRP